jgi:hypothetical protein
MAYIGYLIPKLKIILPLAEIVSGESVKQIGGTGARALPYFFGNGQLLFRSWSSLDTPNSFPRPCQSLLNLSPLNITHNNAQKVLEKLSNVQEKRSIEPGPVISLTRYFWVPKGGSDIRMVYGATQSGLKSCLWAPSFQLHSSESFTDQLED